MGVYKGLLVVNFGYIEEKDEIESAKDIFISFLHMYLAIVICVHCINEYSNVCMFLFPCFFLYSLISHKDYSWEREMIS
jgi:hypothetical protein